MTKLPMDRIRLAQYPAYMDRIRLAQKLFCDERSIRKILLGDPVRGVIGERIRNDLAALGYSVPGREVKAPAAVAARGSVVQVSPVLFTEKDAARYCSCSPGFLRALRAADTKALRGGAPTSGPEWRVLAGSMIRYGRDALDAWIARASVPFATVESKRRPREP